MAARYECSNVDLRHEQPLSCSPEREQRAQLAGTIEISQAFVQSFTVAAHLSAVTTL